jgi:DNA-binding PadR family transcriptional regulator
MTPKNKDLLTSEYMLLGLLDQKPAHGYELFKRIADPEDVGMIWRVKMSNLYAQLNKLERDGMISGPFQPGSVHPSRVEFTISKKGKDIYEQWLTTIVTHPRDLRPLFLLKLFFMQGRADADALSAFIKRQLGECERWLAETQKNMQSIDPANELKTDLLSYRHLVIRSQVDWLKWLLDRS